MSEHMLNMVGNLPPEALAAYNAPYPGNLSIVLSDGQCFAKHEIPEELAEDAVAFAEYARLYLPQMYAKLQEIREERRRAYREANPE